MSVTADYLAFVLEQLAGLGRVSSRRMFGGAGLYHDGLFFGLIDDDVLYFKVGDSNRGDFEACGKGPFQPFPDRPEAVMNYYEVPGEVLEDPELLITWARKAIAVALAGRGTATRSRRRKG